MKRLTKGAAAPLVVAALVSALIPACSLSLDSQSDNDSVATTPEVMPVTLDRHTGLIRLPLDAYEMSFEERMIVDFAWEKLDSECLSNAGITRVPVDRRHDVEPPSRRYGVWTEGVALAYAYMNPPSSPETRRLEARALRASGEEDEILATCRASDPRYQEISFQSTEAQIWAANTYSDTIESAEGQVLIEEWRSCLARHGVTPSESPDELFLPLGTDFSAGDEQKQVATVDVQCKKEVGLVEGLAHLESVRQSKFISEHSLALQEQRKLIDEVVGVARSVVKSS